jgi:threonine synthase
MSAGPSRLRCAGCGAALDPSFAPAFRCPSALPGDDTDHVVARELDLTRLSFPEGGHENPYVRYRKLLHAYHVAMEAGWSDSDYLDLVGELDESVERVTGVGFRETPLREERDLAAALGLRAPLWVKDETANVSGSHKARHLMGVMLYLEVLERTGRGSRTPGGDLPDLAIASCGNAALAAAVVARAAGRKLRVFVPPDAPAKVAARLDELGSKRVACPRSAGEKGDPCVKGFYGALDEGALPFSVQGPCNGLAVEGGHTIAWEAVSQLRDAWARAPDRVFVQVGGGALTSAVYAGFKEAAALGAIGRVPRLHAVQTAGAHPLERAFGLLSERLSSTPGHDLDGALRYAATHRSAFMWPWEQEPQSLARGILDDETYDWLAAARGMLETGGSPVVVPEPTVAEAWELARETTSIPVDPTGSAGLAGLLHLVRQGEIGRDESVLLLFTGVER